MGVIPTEHEPRVRVARRVTLPGGSSRHHVPESTEALYPISRNLCKKNLRFLQPPHHPAMLVASLSTVTARRRAKVAFTAPGGTGTSRMTAW